MIDVLLATYNGEKYLEEMLNSLLRQTYGDYRVLISDDGSTDDTVSIITKYVDLYPDKFYFIKESPQHRGVIRNFIGLMNNASSDYIMFADQDDYWLSTKIEHSLIAINSVEIEKKRETPIVVYSDYYVTDDNLHLIFSPKRLKDKKYGFRHFLVQNHAPGCCMIMNRALYEKTREYNSAIIMHDWWIILYASMFGIVKFIPQKLMYYRQHGDNTVGAADTRRKINRIKRVLNPDNKRLEMEIKFDQGKAFYNEYKNYMNQEQLNNIEKFIDIPNHSNKIIRIILLIKGGYLKDDIIGFMGQIWGV